MVLYCMELCLESVLCLLIWFALMFWLLCLVCDLVVFVCIVVVCLCSNLLGLWFASGLVLCCVDTFGYLCLRGFCVCLLF